MQRPTFPKNLSHNDLLTQLNDPDPKNRRGAAYVLGTKGGAGVAEALVARLTDENAMVRKWVADALGRLGDAAALEALATALAQDSDPDVRMAMAEAIGLLDSRANSALVAALTDSDFRVQAAAAAALERIGDSSVIASLERWLVRNAAERDQYEAGLRATLDAQPERRGGVGAYELMIIKRDAEVRRAKAEHAVMNALAALRGAL